MSQSIMDQIDGTNFSGGARILVVGVGGGGGNAVKNMIDLGLTGVEFICANTDLQALNANPAPVRLQLGEKLTRGLGAGSNPEVGREAANESLSQIQQTLANADMVFVTAGMGGGTGTGAAPIIAETAKKNGALTVAVVTRPFGYEGKKRAAYAQAGIDELAKHVDCLITIPNDRIKTFAPKNTPLRELMGKANDVLYYGVKGISDVITCPGYINLDFADVRTCMAESGLALMGMGTGRGESRAEDAARNAITSPLLEDVCLGTAKAILYNITAPEDITGEEMEIIGERIREAVPEDANIVVGVVFDQNLEDEIHVTVVATGIEADPNLGGDKAKPQGQVVNPLIPNAYPQGQQQVVPQPQPAQRVVMQQPQPQPAPQPAVNRREFRDEAINRWRTEKGPIPEVHEDYYNPLRGQNEINYDDGALEVPAFLRRRLD
ncbi:MAG: cell division protein FtsZ [Desulfovibrionaceae bacterium]|nr:cell division protein FtsZ [Desulfovibrionaceae bacterium]